MQLLTAREAQEMWPLMQVDDVVGAGQWSRDFAARFGVSVPLVAMQHQYMVTEPIKGITPDLPILRDPDRLTYYKLQGGGRRPGHGRL